MKIKIPLLLTDNEKRLFNLNCRSQVLYENIKERCDAEFEGKGGGRKNNIIKKKVYKYMAMGKCRPKATPQNDTYL